MNNQQKLTTGLWFLGGFLLWTAAVRLVDVRAIGPEGSRVGFAGLNEFFHRLTGEHLSLYTLTDWLSLIPAVFVGVFGLLGLIQLIQRRNLWKVDADILVLGIFYLIVLGLYLLFEKAVVNYRPVLIDGALEASYPSSTTMLSLCVLVTAMLQLKSRMADGPCRTAVLVILALFTAFMVISRLISGVHWLTDILGGALLSTGLILLYDSVSSMLNAAGRYCR